jgi:O-antigen/teichoic acid export membrane protein
VVFIGLARLFGRTVLPVLDMRMFALIAAISTLETTWLLFATLYRAKGAAWQYIGASALQAGVGLGATLYLITQRGYRDDGILVGRLVGDATVFGVALVPQLGRYRLTTHLTPARELLRIGAPLIPATFAAMWVINAPRYLLQWYGSVADVGVFAMSSKIAGVIQLLFIQPFAMAWMVSLFTIFKRPDAGRIYARVLTYYVLLGVTLALTVGLLAQVVVPLLAHQRFPLSSGIVVLVALAYVASGLMYPLNVGPYVLEQPTKQVPVFVTSGLLIAGAGIVLVRRWGALGGAVALLLVYLVQAGLLTRLSQRMYRIAFEWARVARVLGAVGAAFGLVWLVGRVAGSPLVRWLLAPLFLATVVLALIAFRVPDPAELAQLRAAAARLWRARAT